MNIKWVYREDAWDELCLMADQIVVGIDPGTTHMGVAVIGVFRDSEEDENVESQQDGLAVVKQWKFVLSLATVSTTRDGGSSIERVGDFSTFPWIEFLPTWDNAAMRRVELRVEKQQQVRFGTFRQDNDWVSSFTPFRELTLVYSVSFTNLSPRFTRLQVVGVIVATARLAGIERIEIVSAHIKLSKSMLNYVGVSGPEWDVPKGAANRIKRKKLAVRLLCKFLDDLDQEGATEALTDTSPESDQYDPADAALTAMTRFSGSEKALKKRKRGE